MFFILFIDLSIIILYLTVIIVDMCYLINKVLVNKV